PCSRNSGSVGAWTWVSPDSEPDKGPARSSMAWIVLWRVRRCPPGVFHDGMAPLSIHNWTVLVATPNMRAAALVVRIGSSSVNLLCISGPGYPSKYTRNDEFSHFKQAF